MYTLHPVRLAAALTGSPSDASRFLAQSQVRMNAIREGRFPARGPDTAPLFLSAADYPPDDLDHNQEVSDFYALKSSRRHFGAYRSSNMPEEEDDEDEHKERATGGVHGTTQDNIRSSWNPR